MHRFNRREAILTAAGALWPVALRGQDPVFRSDTRLVVLHATVLDKDGHLVTNLGREAFPCPWA